MRLFYAVNLPEEIKTELNQITQKFKERVENCRYVSIEHMHITLLFLGDTSEQESKILYNIIQDKIPKEKFQINIDNIGVFKTGKIPRVMYFNISQGEESLKKINTIMTSHSKHILARNKLESQFKGHITFGRLGDIDRKDAAVIDSLINETKVDLTFTVDAITLFESTLTGKGPEYRELGIIRLD